MRNNKIFTGQPTHKPRGDFTQPRGAFDSFQGLQVASDLGLIRGKGLPDSTQTSTQEGLHKGPKPGTRPQTKTTVKDIVDIKTSLKDSVDINDNTRLKQTMQTMKDSNWPTTKTLRCTSVRERTQVSEMDRMSSRIIYSYWSNKACPAYPSWPRVLLFTLIL